MTKIQKYLGPSVVASRHFEGRARRGSGSPARYMPPGSVPAILRRFTRAFHPNPPRGGAKFTSRTSVRGAPLTRQHLNITRTPSNRYTKRAALELLCVPSIFTMAWRSSGATNDELIDNLFANEIASDAVQSAMRSCDRKNYVVVGDAYQDSPQTIGYGATISAPHMHAACLELFEQADATRRGAKVLDVGSGSGYLAACFAELVTSEAFRNGEKDETGEGIVVGIEHIEELVVDSLKNVERDGKGRLLETKRLMLFAGDGRNGYKPEAPYDAIHVGASTPSVPDALLEQLAVGGRLVIPVGDSSGQALKVIDRLEDGTFKRRTEMGVIYVPLTDRASQLSLF